VSAVRLEALKRFLETPPPEAGPVCELCGVAIGEGHPHVADIEHQSLRCSCRACWLLFTNEAAAMGRWRAVPEECRAVDLNLDEGAWESLEIPVGLAFVFRSTPMGRPVAFYPGPAGATESLLGLGAWDELVATHPELANMAPDVEALLVRRLAPGSFSCWIVPVDVCYELVAVVRQAWRGFDGGAEAKGAIEAFFAGLGQRGRGSGLGRWGLPGVARQDSGMGAYLPGGPDR
jgi:hypothetical protein